MASLNDKRNDMPEQPAEVRAHNFKEVALGYTEELAIAEANRCYGCKNAPCVSGCPVNVKIPNFIALVKEGKFAEAAATIKETNSLPAICGRVCPQESQCEGKCIRTKKSTAVAIGRLERFCADYSLTHKAEAPAPIKSNGIKIAIIGAGPSGLTCAGDLIKKGYDVTVFEAFHKAGGVLVYGIPEFRLPKSIVQSEIDTLKALGVKFELNVVVGRTVLIEELFEQGFKSVFIGTGAGLPVFMNIPGENFNGVYSANEYLTRINLMKAYTGNADTPIMTSKKVAVIGGGNVAMDAARCALRLGAEVYIVYRRSLEEMPARKEEIHHAMQEGIDFKLLCAPTEVVGDENGWVKGLKCVEMKLGEPDASGRRRPVAIEGSDFILDVDTVIVAIGTSPNPILKNSTHGLDTNKHGCLVINEDTGETSLSDVYAGGDAVTGAATVILAMGAGRLAADAIDKKLSI